MPLPRGAIRHSHQLRDGDSVGVVSVPSPRLVRRIERDFPAPGSADAVIDAVSDLGEGERVQAAVVLWSDGDYLRLREAIEVAKTDWRDALVRAGLENEDWPHLLVAALGD